MRSPTPGTPPHVLVTLPACDLVDVTGDPAAADRGAVWQFLGTDASWARWRSRDDVDAQLLGAWRVVSAHPALV
jgi:hypothetical protein